MRTKALTGFLVWIAATLLCGTGWALDEAILTPTNDSVTCPPNPGPHVELQYV